MKKILQAKKKESYIPEIFRVKLDSAVKFYRKQGINLLPITHGEKKTYLEEWKEYQQKRNTEEEINRWFYGGSVSNIAVLGGAISGNLVIIDFDDKKIYNKVKNYFPDTYTVKTGRKDGGVHLYYRTERPVRSFKIEQLHIDIKGEGGYVVAPPSLHATGNNYKVINRPQGEKDAITLIKGDFKEELLAILKNFTDFKPQKLHEKVDISVLLDGVKQGNRNDAAIKIATWLRKREVKKEEAWEQLLLWNRKNQPPITEQTELDELKRTLDSAYEREEPYGYNFGDEEVSDREFWTAKEVADAETLLNNKNILNFVKDEALGDVVGNDKFKTTLFLINLHCGNAHILGETATGKSHIVDRVMQCFPLHTWFKITGVTDKAIRYLGREIKHLYLAEWGATGKKDEESTAAFDIKIMMSEGKLRILVVAKDETGVYRTQFVESEIENVITTATNVDLPKELQNRAWETGPEEQTEAVAKFKLDQRTKMDDRINKEKERKRLRCAIEILEQEKPDKFVIPYANELYKIFKPLTERTRTTRDVDKLCDLIEASALLHYRNRAIIERKEKSYLVCLPEDFINAWTYGEDACIGTFVELSNRGKKVQKYYEKILDSGKALTATALAAVCDTTRNSARDWLHKFEHFGLIAVVAKQGRTHIYDYPEKTREKNIKIEIKMEKLYCAYDKWKLKYEIKMGSKVAKHEIKKDLEKIFQIEFPAFVSPLERLKYLPDRKKEDELHNSVGQ